MCGIWAFIQLQQQYEYQKLFDNFIEDNQNISLILEEPFVDKNEKFKVLWENSKHLMLFRKYYIKLMNKCSKQSICRMFPIDIRIPLYDLTPDQINTIKYIIDQTNNTPNNVPVAATDVPFSSTNVPSGTNLPPGTNVPSGTT